MANPEALAARKWLNARYGNNPDFDKLDEIEATGTALWQGLTQALQIELGITPVSGTFGDKTMAACPTLSLDMSDEELGHPFVTILQHGLYSKGYDPGAVTGVYDQQTINAVRDIQYDAGLTGEKVSYSATPVVFKAILGVEEFKLVGSGDPVIRQMQQYLNTTYFDYIGMRACDGIYSRATNQAIIYAFQATEGLPTSVANGNFGNTTKNCCPCIPYAGVQKSYNGSTYSDDAIREFQRLLQYGLYVNGFGPYTIGMTNIGEFDRYTQMALVSFKTFCALSDPDNAVAYLDEWMSLFLSTGNPRRDGTAADTATRLTRSKLQAIVNDGYDTVGRYLTGTFDKGKGKNLLRNELATIFRTYSRPDGTDINPKLFLIYQFGGDGADYFNYDQGYSDAEKAFGALNALWLPKDHFVYFAVDYDFMEAQVKSRVIPYFQGVKDYRDSHNIPYKIGIYGARNTCTLVREAGLSESSFVGDMSTGYSGNKGFPLPQDWAFDQIQEYPLNTADGSINIDKNVVSGRYTGISQMRNDPQPYDPDKESENDYQERLGREDPCNCCGNCTVRINLSDSSMTVYRVKTFEPDGSEKLLDAFDTISPNEFYCVWAPNNGSDSKYVYFRDQYGNLNGGFIVVDLLDTEKAANFGEYSVYYDETSGEYRFANQASKRIREKDEFNCYTFTLAHPLDKVHPDGHVVETLPEGTQIAIQEHMTKNLQYRTVSGGRNYPAICLAYIKRPSEGWEGQSVDKSYYFLDLGMDKWGVSLESRALR